MDKPGRSVGGADVHRRVARSEPSVRSSGYHLRWVVNSIAVVDATVAAPEVFFERVARSLGPVPPEAVVSILSGLSILIA